MLQPKTSGSVAFKLSIAEVYKNMLISPGNDHILLYQLAVLDCLG